MSSVLEVRLPSWNDWPEFRQYGQAYVTACDPGVVKAWHFHTRRWNYSSCIHGTGKIVLFDARRHSPTHGRINDILDPTLVVRLTGDGVPKLRTTLAYAPTWSFEAGLAGTVESYRAQPEWWRPLTQGEFRMFYDAWYSRR